MKTAEEMAKIIKKQRDNTLTLWKKAEKGGSEILKNRYESEYFAIKALMEELEIEE